MMDGVTAPITLPLWCLFQGEIHATCRTSPKQFSMMESID